MTSETDQIFKQLQQQLRVKAESQMARAGAAESRSLPADMLLYDLQVRQMELEMQNEKLQRALADLEASRDLYVDLYDFAPVGYLTVSAEGMIEECNLTFAALLGVERKNLIKQRFDQFIANEDKNSWNRFILQIKQCREKQGCELTLVRDDETRFFAGLECLHVEKNGVPSTLRMTLTDITARKQAEQSLRIAAEAFEAQEAIIVTDAGKTILRANKAFSRITGYSIDEIIGQTPSFLQSGIHDQKFYDSVWAAIAANGYWQGEMWDKRKSGEVFPILLNIARVSGANDCTTYYVGCFTDIALQKQAEKILKNSHSRLTKQIQSTLLELEKTKEEILEANTAVGFLLKQRDSNLAEARSSLSREAERTVLPFLDMLKKAAGNKIESRLIGILEDNLRYLLDSYGSSANLSAVYQKLTPVQIQVASMVRQGWPTKKIAATLNLSSGTVSIHRKHIRKKLGLDNKSINLSSYLLSLNDGEN
ncbi:MAG: PAS domain S-box protein [Gammaproteobacteria bacterium]